MLTYEEIDELLKKGQAEIIKTFDGNIKEMTMPNIGLSIAASLLKIANSLKIIADKQNEKPLTATQIPIEEENQPNIRPNVETLKHTTKEKFHRAFYFGIVNSDIHYFARIIEVCNYLQYLESEIEHGRIPNIKRR